MESCKTIDKIIECIIKNDKEKAIELLESMREGIASLSRTNENLLSFIEKLGGKDGKDM